MVSRLQAPRENRPAREQSMRVLVLGGTQFIGPYVVRRLVSEGHAVTLFHRGRTERPDVADVPHLHGARAELARHADAFRALAPDVVLDMYALGEADARQVVEVFRGLAGRLVTLTSADVYRAYGVLLGQEHGPPDPTPLAEDAPLRTRLYPYRGEQPRAADAPDRHLDDYDKVLVERVVQAEPSLPATVLRLGMIYGPGDGQRRLFPYLKRMDDGRPAIALEAAQARWRAPRAYVANAADAIALAVTRPAAAGRTYNVAEPEALAEADWVRAIAAATGWPGRVVVLPEGVSVGPPSSYNLAQDLALDTTRLRRELGYAERVARGAALRATVAWERANPPPRVDPAQFDYAAEDALLQRYGPSSETA
jgi:nucleoside-diphosphate-sugar epimerase